MAIGKRDWWAARSWLQCQQDGLVGGGRESCVMDHWSTAVTINQVELPPLHLPQYRLRHSKASPAAAERWSGDIDVAAGGATRCHNNDGYYSDYQLIITKTGSSRQERRRRGRLAPVPPRRTITTFYFVADLNKHRIDYNGEEGLEGHDALPPLDGSPIPIHKHGIPTKKSWRL